MRWIKLACLPLLLAACVNRPNYVDVNGHPIEPHMLSLDPLTAAAVRDAGNLDGFGNNFIQNIYVDFEAGSDEPMASEEARWRPGSVRAGTLAAEAIAQGSDAMATALVTALLVEADTRCDAYFTDAVWSRNTTAGGLSVGQTLASAVGAVSSYESQAWAGVSTMFGGSRDALSAEILGEQTMNVIWGAVQAERQKQRTDILQVTQRGVEELPVVMALVSTYHMSCNVTSGLSYLSDYVGEAAQEGAEDATRRLVGSQD